MNEHLFPCPACGFEVFSEPPGSYEICPLCGWEDDHVQLRFPAMAGGANKNSLAEAQVQALKQFSLSLSEAQGFSRCRSWRPLSDGEKHLLPGQPANGLQYFSAAGDDTVPYYWER